MPRTPAAVIAPVQVHRFIETLVKGDLHAARVRSLVNGVIGVLYAATLGVAAIGRGLAAAQGLCDKHAIKQPDTRSSATQPSMCSG